MYLFMQLFQEVDFLLKTLSQILSLNMCQSFLIKVLNKKVQQQIKQERSTQCASLRVKNANWQKICARTSLKRSISCFSF